MTSSSSSSAVFDILLTFCDTSSWTEALQQWFPQGKGFIVAQEDSKTLSGSQKDLTS